jgi:hypothetical protein
MLVAVLGPTMRGGFAANCGQSRAGAYGVVEPTVRLDPVPRASAVGTQFSRERR